MKHFLLKLFIVLSLFFPAFWSTFYEDYKMEYYAVFTAAYGILLLYIAWQLWKGKKKKERRFVLVFSGALLFYNILSLYMNVKYLHWYGEQINNTIAFLFFLFLCRYEDSLGENGDGTVMFFLRSAVLSNILSILYFFMGYTSFLICNNRFYFIQLPEGYYEFRHYWLYSHKSDYALMLVAFIAVCVRFRDRFKSRLAWIGSMGVFLAALCLTHSWTGFLAVGLVFAGAVLDVIDWKKSAFHFRKIYLLGVIPVVLAAAAAGKLLLAERDLFSLGKRFGIWQGAIREIAAHPTGWGFKFGETLFDVYPGWSTNNAHNVFLNALLRFSVPVGLCFIVLLILAAAYSLYRSRSWLGAGMWLAFFVLLNMDYSLLNYELGMFLFVVYLVCIYPLSQKKRVTKEELKKGEELWIR